MNDEPGVQTTTFNIDSPRMRSQVVSMSLLQVFIIWVAISLLFVMLGVAFKQAVDPRLSGMFSLAFFTAAPGYLALVFGVSTFRRIRASFARLRKIPGASLYRCKFFEDRVEYSNDAGMEAKVPYSLVAKISPEPTGIMVSVDPFRLLWIPREAFANDSDFETASKWCLAAQLAKNPAQGQRMG